MKALITSLRVPDFEAKPNVVARKDASGRTVHDITNPEVFAPWSVEISLTSTGWMSRAEVEEIARLFMAGGAVNVEVAGAE